MRVQGHEHGREFRFAPFPPMMATLEIMKRAFKLSNFITNELLEIIKKYRSDKKKQHKVYIFCSKLIKK